jgi:AcrR family transcriptional regulator
MKDVPTDHPKSKLMTRKRAAILDAARETFLLDGYERTSMERIAAQAGVSIMTLYRHAESKEKLFAAVIASACEPDDHAQQSQEALRQPLSDVLRFVGSMFQDRIGSPTTTALLRAVMVEGSRQPELAQVAYSGLIASYVTRLESFLALHPESRKLKAKERRALCEAYFDALVGLDSFGLLLGLERAPERRRKQRNEAATTELMTQLNAIR